MFDEFNENPSENSSDPTVRAREKFDEFRMHAELAAVFEGKRKFEAEIDTQFDSNLAREIQRTIARLEKSRSPEHPVLMPPNDDEARKLLLLPKSNGTSTNDYHIARRPGETLIIRFLEAEQVETFYERFQAHFDAALGQFRSDERSANEWKQDEKTIAYLEALDKIEVKMPDRYLRSVIQQHRVIVLSTQTADEIDIIHLADYLMSVPPAEIVGESSAPPEDGASETDRAWFFKLFSLRGIVENVERMCFFIYLQKTGDDF